MWCTFNGKGLVTSNGTGWGYTAPVNPYNPYNLPSGTIRYMFEDTTYNPTESSHVSSVWTRVSSDPNIWDWAPDQYGSQSLVNLFSGDAFGQSSLRVHILGANFQGLFQPSIQSTWRANQNIVSVHVMDTRTVTDFQWAFSGCANLYEIAGLPIQHNIYQMFLDCTSLRRLPRFEIYGSGTDVGYMFEGCRNVESGILDCYDSLLSSSGHFACFRNCGVDTPTGAAELAQIPSDWK